jgi:cytochrome c oxidase cbb3-type subunit II
MRRPAQTGDDMEKGMTLFLGCLLTFTSSWLGLVFAPMVQIGDRNLKPEVVDENTGAAYPQPAAGEAAEGRKHYVSLGCVYCHSQQVRPQGFGADLERGWGGRGNRRTVARDYIFDRPHQLGTMRTGPDLANVGGRYPAVWQHQHLYQPRMTSPGSVMPAFPFLYEKRKVVGEPSADAVPVAGVWAAEVGTGYEVVPTGKARELVAYLMSLDHSEPLKNPQETE